MSDNQIVEQKTATFVKRVDGNGIGRVYRVEPPMQILSWDGKPQGETEYVWVSAAVTYSGPETYIFASDENGEVTDWGELPGSFRGGLDHAAALIGAGYAVTVGDPA